MQILAYFTNKSSGTLDEHGRTDTIMSADQESLDVFIGFKDTDWGMEIIEEQLDDAEACDPEGEDCEWLGSDIGHDGSVMGFGSAPIDQRKKNLSCIAKGENGEKKSTILTKKDKGGPLLGNTRPIECTYQCTDGNGEVEEIRSMHTEWYSGVFNDDGREGQCLGAQYKSEYSSFANREIYSRTHFASFDPESPKYDSPNLKKWVDKKKKGK